MREIAQIRKLGLWIFLVPFVGINLCLLISVNYSFLENTKFVVDQIGRSNFTIPYLDGSLSISRASRTFPQYLIFKPAMIITGTLLIFYWISINRLINIFTSSDKNFKFQLYGIISAILLIIHSIFLGIEFDIKIIKLFKRIILLGFIICEIIAQALLIVKFYKLKSELQSYFNKIILKIKMVLISVLIIVAVIAIPFLNNEALANLKHGLEWNYFIGVVLFYLLSFFFWKRTT